MTAQERLQQIQERKNEIMQEIGTKKQRFILQMDMYLYADDEQDAINIAKNIIEKERDQYDNQAQILSIHSAPFGSAARTQIYP